MAAPAGDVDDNEEGAVVRAAELKLPTLDVEDGDDDDDDDDDGNNDEVEADGDRDSICITSTLLLK